MSSPLVSKPRTNPELKSLYEISLLSHQTRLQDYFLGVMATLSDFFSVTYAALILQDRGRESLHVEALYGIDIKNHPHHCQSKEGIIIEVLRSRSPMAIHDLSQEPLYGESYKHLKPRFKVQAPLLCIPLIAWSEPFGVININSLFGPGDNFEDDFHYLSILSAILSPNIKDYHLRKEDPHAGSSKSKPKTSLLEEILEERLTEVLNKIDPYVESKSNTGLLEDIVSLVEKILIKSAMEKVGHVQTSAAQLLGINRNTLRAKIKEMKIKFR